MPDPFVDSATGSSSSVTNAGGVWRLDIIQQAPCIYGMPVLPETERKSTATLPNPTLLLIEFCFSPR
jgi:hypothetical protein